MKKITLIMFIVSLFLVGCRKEEEKVKLECELNATTITLTIKDGKIVKYVDKINGEASDKEINVLNDNYLEGIDNNDDAIVKMREVIASNGGDCIK